MFYDVMKKYAIELFVFINLSFKQLTSLKQEQNAEDAVCGCAAPTAPSRKQKMRG